MKLCSLTANFKNIAVGLAILILLFAGWSIWKSVGYHQEKVAFEKDKELREQRIDDLEEFATTAYHQAKKYKEVAEIQHRRVVGLEAALDKSNTQLKKAKEDIAWMQPEEIVHETKRILKVNDLHVWLTQKGIRFSMDAAKKNLGILTEWDMLKTMKIPLMEQIIADQGVEIFVRTQAHKLAFEAYNTEVEINKELKAQILADEEMMKTMEKQIKITRLKTFGGTLLGTAVVVGGIILILK